MRTGGTIANPVMRGVVLMLLAMIMLPCIDTIAKYLAAEQGMSPGQVTFYRFFSQLILILPFLLWSDGLRLLKPKRPWFNLLRGILLAASSLMFFVSVKYMPLADAFAIFFVEPFFLTGLSAILLREKVGWRRWLAIFVGFGGAMIVIQPSFEIFGLTALLPVFCAFLLACYLLLNRVAVNADTPLMMQTIAGFGGSLFMIGAIAVGHGAGSVDFVPSLPHSPLAWILIAILGGISGLAHILMIRAFQVAPVSLLAPFHYLQIITATVLGFLIFGEFPTLSKWLGIAIIICSGLFVIWREQLAGREPPREMLES